MGFHKVYQHMHNGSSRRRRTKERGRVFKEIMAEKLPKLFMNINLHIKETHGT